MKRISLIIITASFAFTSLAQKVAVSQTSNPTQLNIIKSRKPLMVIDGHKQFIRGKAAISGLDESKIASVNILKVSSATLLYGTDGLDGVIEITTKGGSPKVNTDQANPPAKPDSAIKGEIPALTITPRANVKSGDQAAKWMKKNTPATEGNKPLYILDGKEINDIDHLNPDDIESVSVLKGTAATAKYNEKGANGVILITSKTRETPIKN